MLAIVAGADGTIPREHSEALIAEFRPSQAEVRRLECLSHNDIGSSVQYLAQIAEFLGR